MVRLNLSLKLFLILTLLYISLKTFAQDFQITPPKLEVKGRQLHISYDIIDKNPKDQFYIWVEMSKQNGERILSTSLSGDIGEKITAGTNKMIIWEPEKDSIFLNEEIFVEVKAEKYVKTFNKSSAILSSLVLPGLGQTKISNGKPWWLVGVVAYGALAGGIITHQSYLKTYDSYSVEQDPLKRDDWYSQAQKQLNTSNALIISSGVIWIANIIWVAVTPDNYKPLQHVKLRVDKSSGPLKGTTLLTLQLSF
jgi:hypothetical protein